MKSRFLDGKYLSNFLYGRFLDGKYLSNFLYGRFLDGKYLSNSPDIPVARKKNATSPVLTA